MFSSHMEITNFSTRYPKLLQMQLQGGIATSVNQVNVAVLLLLLLLFLFLSLVLFFLFDYLPSLVFLQGPFATAKCFLEGIPVPEQTYLYYKLKVCFKEFFTTS